MKYKKFKRGFILVDIILVIAVIALITLSVVITRNSFTAVFRSYNRNVSRDDIIPVTDEFVSAHLQTANEIEIRWSGGMDGDDIVDWKNIAAQMYSFKRRGSPQNPAYALVVKKDAEGIQRLYNLRLSDFKTYEEFVTLTTYPGMLEKYKALDKKYYFGDTAVEMSLELSHSPIEQVLGETYITLDLCELYKVSDGKWEKDLNSAVTSKTLLRFIGNKDVALKDWNVFDKRARILSDSTAEVMFGSGGKVYGEFAVFYRENIVVGETCCIYGEEIPPTCEKSGSIPVVDCVLERKDCPRLQSPQSIPALGHEWGEWTNEATTSLITSPKPDGSRIRMCQRDGCDGVERELIEECDKCDWVTEHEATCVTARVYRNICGSCVLKGACREEGKGYEAVPALGCDYPLTEDGKIADCTVCLREKCDNTDIAAKKHQPRYNDCSLCRDCYVNTSTLEYSGDFTHMHDKANCAFCLVCKSELPFSCCTECTAETYAECVSGGINHCNVHRTADTVIEPVQSLCAVGAHLWEPFNCSNDTLDCERANCRLSRPLGIYEAEACYSFDDGTIIDGTGTCIVPTKYYKKCLTCGKKSAVVVSDYPSQCPDYAVKQDPTRPDETVYGACTDGLKRYFECELCHAKSEKTIYGKSDFHDRYVISMVESGCTKDGSEVQRCYNVCKPENKDITVIIPTNGHTKKEWVASPDDENRCVEICNAEGCNDDTGLNKIGHKTTPVFIISDYTYHSKGCMHCTRIEYLNHRYDGVAWLDSGDGLCIRYCLDNCGDYRTKGHSWDNPDNKDSKCVDCEAEQSANLPAEAANSICMDGHEVTEWVALTPATAFSKGKEAGSCKYCDFPVTREIPANIGGEFGGVIFEAVKKLFPIA